MPTYTPLRYPGGKRRLVGFVQRLLETNGLHDVQYVEPYAGGAAIAFSLLFEEYASVVHMNDLDRPVFAFWHSVLNETEALCERIKKAKLSIREWKKQREILRHNASANLLDVGFSTLYLNRTNRSGILRGGVIGGLQQTGAWKIDARFGRPELIQRIRKIGRYKERIKIYQMDAADFISKKIPRFGKNTFVFTDPPYFDIQRPLYFNKYKEVADHKLVADAMQKLRVPWIVTYDMAAIHRGIYADRRRLVYGLQYTTNARYQGKEVMFLSDGIHLGETQELFTDTMEMFPNQSRLQIAV
jgi:DNA adenine methylase